MQQVEKNTISKAAISRVIIGIILLILLIEFGFYETYIRHFPAFKDYLMPDNYRMHFNWIMHLHGIIMMGWVLMLLVQPILILKGKVQWHRRVGALSYVLAPLVVLALYLANRDNYFAGFADGGQKLAVKYLVITFPDIVFFAILYSLAIYYRRNAALHMRYMSSTAFLFISPALDRAIGTYLNLPGFPNGIIFILSLIGVITLVDSLRTKRLSPFTLVFSFVLLHKICWELRDTPFWQAIGNAISKIF
jgi:uncharacterized membrane protein YozB (DUF420 family)